MRIGSASDQLAGFPQHEIRQSQTGCRTVELELMSADIRSEIVLPAVLHADAEGHLVGSAKQAHVIVHAVHRSDIPVAGQKSAGQ